MMWMMPGRATRAMTDSFARTALLLACLALGLAALFAAPRASAQGAMSNFTEADFLPPEQAFGFSASMADAGTLLLQYRIAPGYYMYRERFGFEWSPAQAAAGDPVLPAGEVKYDPTFEKDMEVYHVPVLEIRVPVARAGDALALTITSQGCADAGLCYPPEQHLVRLAADGAGGYAVAQTGLARDMMAAEGAAATTPANVPGSGWNGLLQAGDVSLADALGSSGWLATMGVFFLLGILLAFTPCVLPMVPIVSTLVLGGRQAAGAAPSRWRGLGLAALYVLGMSVVYTLMGVAAGLSGVGLAAWLQTPWVLGVFATLLAVLALAMFDVFTFQLPSDLQTRLSARLARIPGGRATGALLMGAISALIVGPCVAAPLAGALLYLSQTGDVLTAALALFALAWGMGVPLLAVGASAGTLLPRTGPWMESVKRLFGMLLLGTAWWMLAPVLSAWVQMLGWMGLAAAAAVMLGAFEPLPRPSGVGKVFAKALGLLLALAAILLGVGLASGGRDLLQPLSHWENRGAAGVAAAGGAPNVKEAFVKVRSTAELDAVLARSDRPVMLDFYADWCVSCKEMEAFTFTDPEVAERMSRMILVQADVTANNADDRALLKRFRLFGPPGIVFFAPGGKLIDDARVVGFQNATRFAAVLERVETGNLVQ
ncbi:Cytochrome c-type biogenesis protein DsbD, protein-disulfide reductase [Orrella dioscoreae]|uniref:Thiol:disulfide interchange protein DsbD n=3 Tax=root TaxID=1 RepID=A0A1C3K6Q6_9BURK|nr:Cytochrome c-type biogenesis protein DsbD, protein-disulfide reductase [Orrella dioscoreae]SOE45973.1 Cytochrome c-type biogenesis protein DsbD, protein-disulfide reductase [Orrella dioscoreae]